MNSRSRKMRLTPFQPNYAASKKVLSSGMRTGWICVGLLVGLLFALGAVPRARADLNHWGVGSLTGDILTGVTYGNGTYLIVGYSGNVWTSQDGYSWTDRTIAASAIPVYATFGNGVFVNSANGISSSTDGIHWSSDTGGYGESYFNPEGAAFLNGEYFVFGTTEYVAYSMDGYAWAGYNNRYGPAGPILYGMAYGNGMYVAVCSSGIIWANTFVPQTAFPHGINGVDPSLRTSGVASDLLGVAYGNSTFVVIGTGGTILTSPDGITWTQQTSGTANTLNAIAFGNGMFVTVGVGGTILTSPDGVIWTSKAGVTTNLLRGIAFTNNKFIAVGAAGTVAIASYPPPPPAIVNQPQGQSVTVGANVTLGVTASGTGPLSYQWRKGTTKVTGTNVAGATSDTLTLSNVRLNQAGSYNVVVKNPNGSVTSGAAVLIVNDVFAKQAGSFAAVLEGGGGFITLGLSGNGSFTAKILLGATSSTLKGTLSSSGDFIGGVGDPPVPVLIHLDPVLSSPSLGRRLALHGLSCRVCQRPGRG
jgi:hypothetical protein